MRKAKDHKRSVKQAQSHVPIRTRKSPAQNRKAKTKKTQEDQKDEGKEGSWTSHRIKSRISSWDTVWGCPSQKLSIKERWLDLPAVQQLQLLFQTHLQQMPILHPGEWFDTLPSKQGITRCEYDTNRPYCKLFLWSERTRVHAIIPIGFLPSYDSGCQCYRVRSSNVLPKLPVTATDSTDHAYPGRPVSYITILSFHFKQISREII